MKRIVWMYGLRRMRLWKIIYSDKINEAVEKDEAERRTDCRSPVLYLDSGAITLLLDRFLFIPGSGAAAISQGAAMPLPRRAGINCHPRPS